MSFEHQLCGHYNTSRKHSFFNIFYALPVIFYMVVFPSIRVLPKREHDILKVTSEPGLMQISMRVQGK